MTDRRDDFLTCMVERRRAAIAGEFGARRIGELEGFASRGRPVRDFAAALTSGDRVALIAEVKKASPSAGAIAPGMDASAQARRYEEGGAAAISVLTEPTAFDGSFDDLAAVASSVRVPVLCKDFVVDEAQILLARGCGADAVLLMVSVLGDGIGRYTGLVESLGMQALVEVVSDDELGIALESGATLVGVNSRDLHTLRVDPLTARSLVGRARREGPTVVLASGVSTPSDVEEAARAGADAVLVGEAVMRAANPRDAVAQLAGVVRGGRA